jgi:hypothetical protein
MGFVIDVFCSEEISTGQVVDFCFFWNGVAILCERFSQNAYNNE